MDENAIMACVPCEGADPEVIIPDGKVVTCLSCGADCYISPQGVSFIEMMGNVDTLCIPCVARDYPEKQGEALPGAALAVAEHLGISEEDAQFTIDMVSEFGLAKTLEIIKELGTE